MEKKLKQGHVGRPTNEDVAKRNKKGKLKIILSIIVIVLVIGTIYLVVNRDNIIFQSLLGASSIDKTPELYAGKTYYYADYGMGYFQLDSKNLKSGSCYVRTTKGQKTSIAKCSNTGSYIRIYANKKGTAKIYYKKSNNDLYYINLSIPSSRVTYEYGIMSNQYYYFIKNSQRVRYYYKQSDFYKDLYNYVYTPGKKIYSKGGAITASTSSMYLFETYYFQQYLTGKNPVNELKTELERYKKMFTFENVDLYTFSKDGPTINQLVAVNNGTKANALRDMYAFLKLSQPTIIATSGSESLDQRYFVVVVGFKQSAKKESLKESDFIIFNPLTASFEILGKKRSLIADSADNIYYTYHIDQTTTAVG